MEFSRERTRSRNSLNIGEGLVPASCLSVRMSGKSLGDSGSIRGAGYLAERVTLRDGLQERRALPGELSSPKFSDSHHFLEGSYSVRLKVFLLFGASLGLSSHSGIDILERALSSEIHSSREVEVHSERSNATS